MRTTGFLLCRPALFDRVERGVELGYEGADRERGIAIGRKMNLDDAAKDVAAALGYLQKSIGKKCGVIGYCLGGSVAWLAATRLNPSAAVGYYGGHIIRFVQEIPAAR